MSAGNGHDPSDAEKANAFARGAFGGDPDAAAGASGLKILPPGESGGPPKKPRVELPGDGHRVIADFARDLGAHLADVEIFRREDLVVTVDAESGEVKPMDAKRFLTWIVDYAVLYEKRNVKVGKDYQPIEYQRDMPLTTAETVLRSDCFISQLKKIIRVNQVQAPWRRSNGKIELLPIGYDEESQIFTLNSGIKIDETMTLAKSQLVWKDIFGEFPIEDARSFSIAIVLPLSLWGVGLQPMEASRLGCVVIANTRRAGKSLIAQIGISAVYGWPKATPKMKDEAEFNKTLASIVLQGQPYIFIDNLKGHFENSNLEAFLTSPEVQVRVMGTHRFISGKVCCIPILTGNNLSLSDDMKWRVLQCNLYEPEFNPMERSHRRDLNPVEVNRKEIRSDLLSALWAMIRNWDAAGRPCAGAAEKPFRIPGFAQWSDIFGGIMQAAGYANPLAPVQGERAAATETVHQQTLIEELAAVAKEEKKPMKEFTFEQLIGCCIETELLTWKFNYKEKDGKYTLSSADASTMGKFFTNEMASKVDGQQRFYRLKDGTRVGFHKTGEGRAKRYVVELLLT